MLSRSEITRYETQLIDIHPPSEIRVDRTRGIVEEDMFVRIILSLT